MRVVFAIAAVLLLSMSALSTSAHARECYKLSWAERGECIRTDPTFPVRWTMCLDTIDDMGFKGSGIQNRGVGAVFNRCMHNLSPLSMQELASSKARHVARDMSERHFVWNGWGSE
jgi:hypothetical protein